MNKLKLKWQKVASVTHGGQPHFWICLINGRKVYTVVWDRCVQKWAVNKNDIGPLKFFDTALKGKKYAEELHSGIGPEKFDHEAFEKFLHAPPNEPRPIGF